MKRYIFMRIVYAILMLFGVAIITFIMVRLLPGDPIRAAMEQGMDINDETVIQEVRARYGLDRPVHVQFYIWIVDFFKGDWGTSLTSGDKVTSMFWRRLPVTLELFVLATFWAWILGIPLGIISAIKRNTWLDFFITGGSVIGLPFRSFGRRSF